MNKRKGKKGGNRFANQAIQRIEQALVIPSWCREVKAMFVGWVKIHIFNIKKPVSGVAWVEPNVKKHFF